MSDDEPIMRPVERVDLEVLRRFSIEPDALGEFEWFGFTDPNVRQRRWEQDGLIGKESSTLAITHSGTLAGILTWRSVPLRAGAPEGGAIEIGIGPLPEHRGQGLGMLAQGWLVDYLFRTTLANRIETITEEGNIPEQKALDVSAFSLRARCADVSSAKASGATVTSTRCCAPIDLDPTGGSHSRFPTRDALALRQPGNSVPTGERAP